MSSTLLPISSSGGFTTTSSITANSYELPDSVPATLYPHLILNEGTGNLNATATIQMVGDTQGFFVAATSGGNYDLWFNSAVRDADGNIYVVGGNDDNNNGSIWSFSAGGGIRWKTSVDQIVSGQRVRTESVRIDTENDRVIVTLEWYDGTSDQEGWMALSPADGSYITSTLLSSPVNASPYVADIVIDGVGEPIMAGRIEGEYVATTGLIAQPGTTTNVLWINNSDLPIAVDPSNSPTWQIDSQPAGPANWVYTSSVNVINNLATETLTGTGTGAQLQVRWTGVSNTYDSIWPNGSGTGYAIGDRLRVRGSLLNGVDNTDITATATSTSDVGANTVAVFDKATYPTLGSVTTGWHAFFPSGLAYDVVGSAVDTGTTWEITVVSNGVDFSGPVMFTGAGNDCIVYVYQVYYGNIYLTPLWQCPSVAMTRFETYDPVDFTTGGPWSVRYALDGQASIWTSNWQHTYGGTSYQQFGSIARNAATGDIYTLGNFYYNDGSTQFKTNLMKLDSNGVTQWSKYVEDSNASGGSCGSVAVDGTGNVYVIGENNNGYTVVTKLDSDGTLIWQVLQTNDSNWDNEPRGAIDSDGNVYVAGVWYNGNDDVVSIAKLSAADGSLVWSRQIGNTENYNMREFNDNDTQPLSVEGDSFVYTGYVYDVNDSNYDALVVRMKTDGSGTGTHGRWTYTDDSDTYYVDNTSDASITTNSNGVPVDLVTQSVSGSTASVTANNVGYSTVYTNNSISTGGGGIMFADGTVQTTAASSGGGSSISNGDSTVTIPNNNGNVDIVVNGYTTTFDDNGNIMLPVNGSINARPENNMEFILVDPYDDGYRIKQVILDQNGNDLTRVELERNRFQITTDVQNSGHQWEFTNSGEFRIPGFIGTFDRDITISGMNAGYGGNVTIRTMSNSNDYIYSKIDVLQNGINLTANVSSGSPAAWEFRNTGVMALPAGGDIVNSSGESVLTPPVKTIATLGTQPAGTRGFISDSELVASGNFGTVVTGGGANTVPVWSDGTSWHIG